LDEDALGTIKIHKEKSMKDSGHEKEIAEYGRNEIREEVVWAATRKTKQEKRRESSRTT